MEEMKTKSVEHIQLQDPKRKVVKKATIESKKSKGRLKSIETTLSELKNFSANQHSNKKGVSQEENSKKRSFSTKIKEVEIDSSKSRAGVPFGSIESMTRQQHASKKTQKQLSKSMLIVEFLKESGNNEDEEENVQVIGAEDEVNEQEGKYSIIINLCVFLFMLIINISCVANKNVTLRLSNSC